MPKDIFTNIKTDLTVETATQLFKIGQLQISQTEKISRKLYPQKTAVCILRTLEIVLVASLEHGGIVFVLDLTTALDVNKCLKQIKLPAYFTPR